MKWRSLDASLPSGRTSALGATLVSTVLLGSVLNTWIL